MIKPKEIKKLYRRNAKLIITVAAALLILAAFASGELKHTQLSSYPVAGCSACWRV